MTAMTFHWLQVHAATWMGSQQAILGILGFTVLCLASGPWIGWLLVQVILTTTLTVVTQLTAMLIQGTSIRSERGLQEKLDEVIRAIPQADNRKMGVEHDGPSEGIS